MCVRLPEMNTQLSRLYIYDFIVQIWYKIEKAQYKVTLIWNTFVWFFCFHIKDPVWNSEICIAYHG